MQQECIPELGPDFLRSEVGAGAPKAPSAPTSHSAKYYSQPPVPKHTTRFARQDTAFWTAPYCCDAHFFYKKMTKKYTFFNAGERNTESFEEEEERE